MLAPNNKSKTFYNRDTATNKLQDGYNPSNKLDCIRRCLIQNANFLTKHSELDICGDEKSWETSSYGEAGDGLIGRIANKPGITKGV